VEKWLDADTNNMVGINCKAGKGRTGLIICCYLLQSNQCHTTDEALEVYGKRRTKDGKGVTIASQIRYIRYYERLLKDLHSVIPEAKKIVLTKLVVTSPPKLAGQPLVWIDIENIVSHRSKEIEVRKKQKEIDIIVDVMCEGDCKIQLVHKQGKKLTKVCHFWFNTGFVEGYELKLTKAVIDVANKDKRGKIFKHEFALTAHFRDWNENTDKEEVYNNWKSKSLANQKRAINEPKVEKEEDEGPDTDSSIELKAEYDEAEEKKEKKKKPDEKKEKKLKKEEKVEKDKSKKITEKEDKDEIEKDTSNGQDKKDDEKDHNHHLDFSLEADDDSTRKKTPSFYKYGGYNLPIKITDSEEESVDVSDDCNETSCEVKALSLSLSASSSTAPETQKSNTIVTTTTITTSTDNGAITSTGMTIMSDSVEVQSLHGSNKEKQ